MNAAQVVRLETARLVLRPFVAADLEPFARISADPVVMKFVGEGRPLGREDTWRVMAMLLGQWQLRGYGVWAAEEKATGEFIGRIGLLHPEGWPGVELTWLLDRSCWGRGLATEGAIAARDWAFDELGVEHIVSVIYPDNEASIRVAERIGERFERMIEFKGHKVCQYGMHRP